MVRFNSTFDAGSVEPREPMEVLPAGDYLCHITESEMKDTKAGNGQYLQLTLEVLEGEFATRKLWERLNLVNPNQTAVDIAQRTLSSICRAAGVMNIIDSEDLHYKPMMVKVKVKPARGDYDASNEIKGYAPPPSGSSPAASPRGGGSTPF